MLKVMFVDDRPQEVIRQWQTSGCNDVHVLVHVDVFDSVEQTSQLVKSLHPDVVVIGYGLGKSDVTGVDVIRALKGSGFTGKFVANSGDVTMFDRSDVPTDASADRKSLGLRKALETLERSTS